jgi:hypothetical protein
MKDFTNFYGIIYKCPVEKRLPNCPINDVENFLFIDKLQWFEKFTYEEKSKIIKHHLSCSDKRK